MTPKRAAALPLLAAVVVALACGGGATAPQPSPSPAPPTVRATPSPTVTPTPSPTATPAATETDAGWWEDTATPDAERPDSRIWNVRAEESAPGEAVLSFDYFLSLAPEANVFVHMGFYPDVGIALLDAAGETLGSAAGNLRPTEFGDDTVGGVASFAMAVTRMADIAAANICIRVLTGNYGDFAGRTELLCEPFPVER